jgi:preprotein translocase subunit Sss1
MDTPHRKEWIRAAFLVGAVYFLVGIVFANLVHGWRLAAWVVSGVAYVAHIWFEHFRLRNSPRLAALHVAVAVAIGAFGLAVVGMIHSLSTASTIRPAWLLAIVVWPAVTAIPAFLGALVAGAILSRRA